jgi:hypothetical protein
MAAEEVGTGHLVRITWYQVGLLPLGGLLWLARSWRASLVFLAGGAASIAFWCLHRWVVAGMLTPSVRRRWIFGFLVLAKLALIVLLLRGMMICFPAEVLPFVTGILLFSVSIVLEAFWLVLRSE